MLFSSELGRACRVGRSLGGVIARQIALAHRLAGDTGLLALFPRIFPLSTQLPADSA